MFENKEEFKKAFLQKMKTMIPKSREEISNKDAYSVLATLIKEDIFAKWVDTNKTYLREGVKQVYYFSIEFLIGKLLISNLLNMGVLDICRDGLQDLGFDLEELEAEEKEAGLGNGGLGRLAACFLDSLASLGLPGHGCGIRYKYGLFNQKIIDGYQVEVPDYWLNDGYIWEVRHPEKAVEVRFGGEVEVIEEEGKLKFRHFNYERVKAVPYDVPIVGYGNQTINTLRLWNAEVPDDLPYVYQVGEGNREKYLNYKQKIEAIVEFLYPDDSSYEGRLLRLKQQYFLCSAGLQSIIASFEKQGLPYSQLPRKVSLHINDTHPALLIPELMRILMDEKGLGWDEAWEITSHTVSYTNHTIMAEALEVWPVDMFKNLLPRIYQIVNEINERFCQKLWTMYPGDFDRIAQMAIIADYQIKMANLAVAASYSVNGVSPLHTEILTQKQLKLFYTAFPEKFSNKTNGITHRRWLLKANPDLANLISKAIGDYWIQDPQDMIRLIRYKNDAGFLEELKQVKKNNKEKLAKLIRTETGITVDTNSIFDVQAKRLHAYKRQLLNILHIMYLYNRLKETGSEIYPHTFIFAAKAAPSYYFAKRVIKLINTVAEVINNDAEVNDYLKVIFLENYSVSLAEKLIPAADVSEQISTASLEASGTGNMKFMMNGALTLGTLDGANVDIYQLVGEKNIFIFGLTAAEVLDYHQKGGYSAYNLYQSDQRLRKVLDQLVKPGFLIQKGENFESIYYSLFDSNDYFFVLKDFASYVEAHKLINTEYQNSWRWYRKSVVNIAHSGKFSSDRTISEYAADIWKIGPERSLRNIKCLD